VVALAAISTRARRTVVADASERGVLRVMQVVSVTG
jgi:hypothetical protein